MTSAKLCSSSWRMLTHGATNGTFQSNLKHACLRKHLGKLEYSNNFVPVSQAHYKQ